METRSISEPKTFFEEVIQWIAAEKLTPYTANQPENKTGFSLKQLASTLYPYEVSRAARAAGNAAQTVFNFGLLVLAAAVWGVFVYVETMEAGIFLSFFGFIGIGVLGAHVKEATYRRAMSEGQAVIYAAELKRFAAAMEQVLAHLEMDLEQLEMNGLEKVRQLAHDRLLIKAVELARLKRQRDRISHDKDEFTRLDNEGRARRDVLMERYEALATIGIAKHNGYRDIIREAHRLVDEEEKQVA